MNGMEFYDRIGGHADLDWLGCRAGEDPGEDEAFIVHLPTGTRRAVAIRTILDRDWEELEPVLTGRADGRVLTHVTRIIGYFSFVHGWNRSKHAELRDRQRGNYCLPEATA